MRTNDLLTALLYGLDMALRPTLSNLTASEPDWARESGLRPRDWQRVAKKGLVDRSGSDEQGWAAALTAQGRLAALGGRDPDERWGRSWDGRWRTLMFDLSKPSPALRQQLSRWLHANHFGCLQRSVWITPDECPDVSTQFAERSDSVGEFVVLEATVARGFAGPREVAANSWNFTTIDRAYQDYISFVGQGEPPERAGRVDFAWLREEGSRWRSAVSIDPMLPEALLPDSYLGKRAWALRQKLIAGH